MFRSLPNSLRKFSDFTIRVHASQVKTEIRFVFCWYYETVRVPTEAWVSLLEIWISSRADEWKIDITSQCLLICTQQDAPFATYHDMIFQKLLYFTVFNTEEKKYIYDKTSMVKDTKCALLQFQIAHLANSEIRTRLKKKVMASTG